MTTFVERLKQVREYLGISQKKMGELMGIKQQAYCRYEQGDQIPRVDRIEKLGENTNINLHWLLTGKGSMWIDKEQIEKEEEISLPYFEDLYAGASYGGGKETSPAVSVLKLKKNFLLENFFPPGFHFPFDLERLFIIKSIGDSMSPIIESGDFVLIYPIQEVISEKIHFFQYKNEFFIKKIQRLYKKTGEVVLKCISENPAYDSFYVNPKDLHLIGIVVGRFSKLI